MNIPLFLLYFREAFSVLAINAAFRFRSAPFTAKTTKKPRLDAKFVMPLKAIQGKQRGGCLP